MSRDYNFKLRKIAILGLGLIGGSLALALQEKALAEEIIGLDRNEESIQTALEKGAIKWGTTDFIQGVKDADLVILATPVGVIKEVLQQIILYLKPGCIITDVGSTKQKVVEEVEKLLPPQIFFVGGHPMTGSEQSGMKAAKGSIFQGATYLVTPTEKTNQQALIALKELIGCLGCQVIEMSPQEHDLAVASVSHLPHIVAVSLVDLVGRLSIGNANLLNLAAGGFRDTTRVASSHPIMWRDICLTNKEGLLEIIEQFEDVLLETKKIILQEDNEEILLDKLVQAKKIRESIPVCQKGDSNETCSSA